ncbi:MAG TPA: PP2C family protein-serine/threonine phosphatase [Bryobacteraceae bacterium]|nr:PP2C family protein-serine/threonine phosphatase [Bryobacteraceae bacterium]
MLSARRHEQNRDETIELQQKLARVQSLLEASRRVHSTIRLDDVLAGVLETAAKELEAEGAFFASTDAELESRARVYGEVPDDWTRWTERTEIPGYASAPLTGSRGETIAHLVIYRPEPLSLEEADFLEGLALQSALAVGNAQHHEKMLEWERVQLDLDAARAIQRSLLPQTVPDVEGYSLTFRSTTCYEVGGDYVDILPLADGRMMLVLADVAGKGLASAMISVTFRSSFRAIAGAGLPLDEMAARLNDLHWQEGLEARRRYVTAILVCVDPRSHSIEAVNAGHNPAFLTDAAGKERARIGASGPPLGMLPSRTYQTERFEIQEGNQLLLYTDGLTEVFRGDDEFGEDRLLGLMGEVKPAALLDHVWKTLARFAGSARQTDDMTALYLCREKEGATA